METLIPEKETQVLTETQEKTAEQSKKEDAKKKDIQKKSEPTIFDLLKNRKTEFASKEETLSEPKQTAYLQSLENKTVEDIMEERRKKEAEEFAKEKEKLIEAQYAKKEEKPDVKIEEKPLEKTIEKPNFDLMEENKSVVRLFKRHKMETKQKKKKASKVGAIALTCALAGAGIVCVANTIIIDNMNKSLLQIDETYRLNLQKYLKEITKLDQTNKSLEFLDTYPDDLLDAGEIGEKSNWFDKLCNFFGGIFGG